MLQCKVPGKRMEKVFQTERKLRTRTGSIPRPSQQEFPLPCIYRKVCKSKPNAAHRDLCEPATSEGLAGKVSPTWPWGKRRQAQKARLPHCWIPNHSLLRMHVVTYA